jgi:hypothetical protein
MATEFALVPEKFSFFTSAGALASGYQLFVYGAGGSTKSTTHTESDGLTANTNPIVLNARGETASGVYVATGSYKLVLATDTDTDPPASAIWTRDNISAINDTATTQSEWVSSALTATYVNATQFTLLGDKTSIFHVGRRIKITDTAGTGYGTISATAFTSLTTVTTTLDAARAIDSGISAVSYSLLSATNKAVPHSWDKGPDVASAAALPVDVSGNYFDVTGTVTVTSLKTRGENSRVQLHFDGALILTHHATNLILPGGVNITTVAGDEAEFVEYGAGTWRCVSYQRTAKAPATNPIYQIVSSQTGAVATGTTVMVSDDTIPQNTEGDEYLTLAITPNNTAHNLIIDVVIVLAHSGSAPRLQVALFQDSTADALAAVEHQQSTGATSSVVSFRHYMAAGTVSATTFKVRAGASASGTITVNGYGGARKLGGVQASSITITEVQ